uniref:PI31 proteasome regulator N-terminal domain-containing protein n=1 Tax=Spongospora subterranea TaxID=70186 RepID=A0A0H5RCC7_9EUKA|eukprot:CRZ11401.1 hypothetical protein [Spongospora subterranea]
MAPSSAMNSPTDDSRLLTRLFGSENVIASLSNPFELVTWLIHQILLQSGFVCTEFDNQGVLELSILRHRMPSMFMTPLPTEYLAESFRLPAGASVAQHSFRYRSDRPEFTFDLHIISVNLTIIAHARIASDRNIFTLQFPYRHVDVCLVAATRLLGTDHLRDLVGSGIIAPVRDRWNRLVALTGDALALQRTLDELRPNCQDPIQLVCAGIHCIMVNNGLRLLWANNADTPCDSPVALPAHWASNGNLFRFGYSVGEQNPRTNVEDILLMCLPFPSADKIIVTAESTRSSSDLCLEIRKSTVKLSIRSYTASDHLQLKNLPGLILTITNSICKVLWKPVMDADSLYLSPPLLLMCLSFLSYKDLSNIRCVNPYLGQIGAHPILWKDLYRKRHGYDNQPVSDWKSAFIFRAQHQGPRPFRHRYRY